ncbi:dnaJ homolog subfamily C member 30-like [Mizuhopecten yessoensis]|uniref:DnaJ-like subfamily C member 30 n=1 Tax=Mizuhopecten yessoensis TaxID=6573 RepID=A0A210R6I2_MIZYE|nr:dnaJ homolog subfamily C member 30-like [Mizuhopecten yessoensis]OWF56622.1 DnaJ-like subfamily C member 30 [Mizuhopecten yessoensis]
MTFNEDNITTPCQCQENWTDQIMLSYFIRHLKGQACLCVKQSFPNAYRPSIIGTGHNVTQRRNRSGTHKKFKHEKKDLYEILELSQKATSVQIKGSYFRLSKKYHPDINKSKDAAVKFAEIADAYEILGKTHSRNMYDKGLIEEDDLRNTGHPDGWKAYRKGFKKYDGPPMRGRTTIYDFDAWTRNHYSEVFEKRNTDKQKFEEYHLEKQEMEERSHQWSMRPGDHMALALFITVFVGIMVLMSKARSNLASEYLNFESEVFSRKDHIKKRKADQIRRGISKDLETNLATD